MQIARTKACFDDMQGPCQSSPEQTNRCWAHQRGNLHLTQTHHFVEWLRSVLKNWKNLNFSWFQDEHNGVQDINEPFSLFPKIFGGRELCWNLWVVDIFWGRITSERSPWPKFPLKCANARYHQTICAVKSHSRALANIPKHWKSRKTRRSYLN